MKNNKPKPRHKPPSRIRYEKRNPVFSIRMPQEWHSEFKTLAEGLGLSRREFMAIALKKLMANYSKVRDKAYNEGLNDGYNQGYEKGKQDWRIQFPCKICGELVYILPNSECHQAVIEYMKQQGWGHKECHEQ